MRALVVIGKAPQPMLAKTRLVPPLSAESAAELAGAFLRDTLDVAHARGWERVTLIYPPSPAATRLLQSLAPPDTVLLPQPGQGLGAALRHAFEWHFRLRFERVVLVGSDSPTLPVDVLDEAAAALDVADVVVGPSRDGGYYLLGQRRASLELFDGISWSTERVLDETLARAAETGRSVRLVRDWYDVDTPADLDLLVEELRRRSAVAPCTRQVLTRLGYLRGTSTSGERPDLAAYA